MIHSAYLQFLNPLSDNPTKWSNTLKQNCLCVFDHFMALVFKRLKNVKYV